MTYLNPSLFASSLERKPRANKNAKTAYQIKLTAKTTIVLFILTKARTLLIAKYVRYAKAGCTTNINVKAKILSMPFIVCLNKCKYKMAQVLYKILVSLVRASSNTLFESLITLDKRFDHCGVKFVGSRRFCLPEEF